MSNSSVERWVEEQWISALRIGGLVAILLTAGCAWMERTPPQSGASPSETMATESSATRSADQSEVRTDSPDAGTPAKAPAAPVPADQTRKKDGAAPGAGKQAAVPPLDLATLEKRLRETDAIGAFTKIALKNQVDDLLDQFRAHYQGRSKASLPELRQAYDMLLLKVLSLLQDDDPTLARMIGSSREPIWGILADPVKFSAL